jgi:hypothetical protein
MTTRSALECEMSRSCQSATFSSPTAAAARTTRASPQSRSATLVRHRGGALLAAPERLLHLAHLRSREVSDLRREALEGCGAERERAQELRVTVARDDLRRDVLGQEPEPFAGDAFDLGVAAPVRPDGAGELPDAYPLERATQPLTVARELERPSRELRAEGRGLGMHAVRPPDGHRLAVLVRACDDGVERTVEAREQERACVAHLERECRVEHVGGREPVVEPAAGGAEIGRDGVHERGEVVLRPLLDLRHALGGRRRGSCSNLGHVGGGDGPDLGPAVEGGELHLEPARELPLLRPDRVHGRPGVALDHRADSRRGSGRRP